MIDWIMVETKQENLAEALGLNRSAYGQNEHETFHLLRDSGLLSMFENSNGRVTSGAAGKDIILMARTKLGLVSSLAQLDVLLEGKDISDPIEYWIGYALGYLQGRSGWTFEQIFEKYPLERWRDMYILHEVGDETLWDKTIGKFVKEDDHATDTQI